MKKVLYIAKFFPPVGGAGVQRTVKFVKYLPDFGFAPVVLTEPAATGDRWSPEDSSMGSEIPGLVEVYRAEWQCVPEDASVDARRRIEAMVRKGVEAAKRHEVEVIFVTMSPFGDAEVAERISKELGIPWVADLRDPWAFDEFILYRSRFHRWKEQKHMGSALQSASAVVMNTPEAAKLVSRAFPALRKRRVESLTNGYDAEDFSGPSTNGSDGKFTIVHSGYLHTEAGLKQDKGRVLNQLLGRTIKGVRRLCRSHFFLLQALEKWVERDPSMMERLEIVFIGVTSDADRRLAEQSRLAEVIRFTGYLSHQDSVNQVRTADLLFFPMHGLASGNRSSIVPGKAYEYMASGRSILAAVPEGDARDFLTEAGSARICDPDDVSGLLRHLEEEYEQWQAGGGVKAAWRSERVERFERRALTKRLAGILEEASMKGN